jgi:FixJ family two-component response regulator
MQRGVDEDPWRLVLPDRRSAFDGTGSVMVSQPHVAVVDDDESVRESLPDLLRELGYEAKPFASAEDFLASGCIGDTRCLIVDVAMPGMSGLELYRELILQGHAIPVIFITALTGKSLPRALLQEGAVACLIKPFSEQDLRGALAAALPGT